MKIIIKIGAALLALAGIGGKVQGDPLALLVLVLLVLAAGLGFAAAHTAKKRRSRR